MTYYVKLDTDGWVTGTPATEQATDSSLTAINIPVTSIQYFLRYPTKYRVVNGELRAPANLPDLDIDSLKSIVEVMTDIRTELPPSALCAQIPNTHA